LITSLAEFKFWTGRLELPEHQKVEAVVGLTHSESKKVGILH
jgi:hypothetical protein